jgi:hypothetical protein
LATSARAGSGRESLSITAFEAHASGKLEAGTHAKYGREPPARVFRQRMPVHLPIFASSDGVHKTRVVAACLGTRAFRRGRDASRDQHASRNALPEGHIGGENDQVDRCCLCLGRRNICARHVPRAASSAGQHDHAGAPSMRRGYAHGQRPMRDHIRPPPRPPRRHPPTLMSAQSRAQALPLVGSLNWHAPPRQAVAPRS